MLLYVSKAVSCAHHLHTDIVVVTGSCRFAVSMLGRKMEMMPAFVSLSCTTKTTKAEVLAKLNFRAKQSITRSRVESGVWCRISESPRE